MWIQLFISKVLLDCPLMILLIQDMCLSERRVYTPGFLGSPHPSAPDTRPTTIFLHSRGPPWSPWKKRKIKATSTMHPSSRLLNKSFREVEVGFYNLLSVTWYCWFFWRLYTYRAGVIHWLFVACTEHVCWYDFEAIVDAGAVIAAYDGHVHTLEDVCGLWAFWVCGSPANHLAHCLRRNVFALFR